MNQTCEKGCLPETGCNNYGHDKIEDCKFWKKVSKSLESSTASLPELKKGVIRLGWSGNSLGMNSLRILAERSSPIVIGVVGLSNSGKTTFLSLIYLMLISGKKIGDWSFVNSYTLLGWENIISGLKWSPENVYQFPPHTSMNDGRTNGLLHLCLRKGNLTKDIVFTDVAGEWFSNWAIDKNAENAEGAVWIQENADAFISLLDSDLLSEKDDNKLSKGIQDSFLLLDRLVSELKTRPLAFLWSKADEKRNIEKPVIERVDDKFKKIKNSEVVELDISYKPKLEEEDEEEYRDNILLTIDWILKEILTGRNGEVEISASEINDFFLTFRGIKNGK